MELGSESGVGGRLVVRRRTPQHHAAQAQVAKLLPPGWDLERDILLIVGEDAGQIAGHSWRMA